MIRKLGWDNKFKNNTTIQNIQPKNAQFFFQKQNFQMRKEFRMGIDFHMRKISQKKVAHKVI